MRLYTVLKKSEVLYKASISSFMTILNIKEKYDICLLTVEIYIKAAVSDRKQKVGCRNSIFCFGLGRIPYSTLPWAKGITIACDIDSTLTSIFDVK